MPDNTISNSTVLLLNSNAFISSIINDMYKAENKNIYDDPSMLSSSGSQPQPFDIATTGFQSVQPFFTLSGSANPPIYNASTCAQTFQNFTLPERREFVVQQKPFPKQIPEDFAKILTSKLNSLYGNDAAAISKSNLISLIKGLNYLPSSSNFPQSQDKIVYDFLKNF